MKFDYIFKELLTICRKGLKVSLIFSIVVAGCKKFVQISPPVTQIAATTVFTSNTSAAAAVTGIYSNMMANPTGKLSSGLSSVGFLQGLASDELKAYNLGNAVTAAFYANSLSSSTNGASNNYYWLELYNEIYAANSVIEGLQNAPTVNTAIKQQLIGEAKFIRAFLHFYAVNLYGDVPLVTSTNYLINNTIGRTAKAQVYQQIIQDMKDAQAALSANFVDGAGLSINERVRPNRGAATAMLARTYLYSGKWDSAETQATALIANSSQYGLVNNFDSVFLKNSKETIWQLQPVLPGYNTFDGYYYVLTSAPGTTRFPAALSNNILSAFEPSDKRYTKWIGRITVGTSTYYYSNKYKVGIMNTTNPVTEYQMVLRLSEQYLIRAEARVQKGDISGAQADLNIIRARAGLSSTTASDQSSLLNAILHERQVELFTEWGHRWFDLIRMGAINSVMGSPGNVSQAKGGTWNQNWILLPIPLTETQINLNLSQNAGYN